MPTSASPGRFPEVHTVGASLPPGPQQESVSSDPERDQLLLLVVHLEKRLLHVEEKVESLRLALGRYHLSSIPQALR